MVLTALSTLSPTLLDSEEQSTIVGLSEVQDASDLFDQLVTSKGQPDETVINVFGKDFLIPANCSFLMVR